MQTILFDIIVWLTCYTFAKQVYPRAKHASCTVHLWRNIKARFKSKRLASLMGAAARAYTIEEFNKKFLDIQRVSPRCAGYLVEIGIDFSNSILLYIRYSLVYLNSSTNRVRTLDEGTFRRREIQYYGFKYRRIVECGFDGSKGIPPYLHVRVHSHQNDVLVCNTTWKSVGT